MKLITDEQRAVMLENGRQYARNPSFDPMPVVKLFNPGGAGTWLLTDLDPDDPDIASGLCDLGCPELGSVRISELEEVRTRFGLGIEPDLHFKPRQKISKYAEDARRHRYIDA